MTTRADYTSEEWALLVEAPEMIGLGMLTVSRSGPAGKLRELRALRASLRIEKAPDEVRHNPLIMAILTEQQTLRREFTEPLSSHGDLGPLLRAIIMSRLYMLAHSEEVADLLADTAPYTEAQEVKHWLMWIARRVASASGDRWLGTGQKISAVEDSMLQRLAAALGTVTIVDATTAPEIEALLGSPSRSSDDADGGEEDATSEPRGDTES